MVHRISQAVVAGMATPDVRTCTPILSAIGSVACGVGLIMISILPVHVEIAKAVARTETAVHVRGRLQMAAHALGDEVMRQMPTQRAKSVMRDMKLL